MCAAATANTSILCVALAVRGDHPLLMARHAHSTCTHARTHIVAMEGAIWLATGCMGAVPCMGNIPCLFAVIACYPVHVCRRLHGEYPVHVCRRLKGYSSPYPVLLTRTQTHEHMIAGTPWRHFYPQSSQWPGHCGFFSIRALWLLFYQAHRVRVFTVVGTVQVAGLHGGRNSVAPLLLLQILLGFSPHGSTQPVHQALALLRRPVLLPRGAYPLSNRLSSALVQIEETLNPGGHLIMAHWPN